MFFAWNAKLDRLGARRDENEPTLQRFAGYFHRAWPDKARAPLIGLHALLLEALLHHARNALGKAALERHQGAPVDRELATAKSVAAHAARMVERLGGSNEDLLGIAAAQGTGPAVGQMINHRDAPAGVGAAVCGRGGCGAGSNDDKIEGLRHPGISKSQLRY